MLYNIIDLIYNKKSHYEEFVHEFIFIFGTWKITQKLMFFPLSALQKMLPIFWNFPQHFALV
jgi:hypothetical protein